MFSPKIVILHVIILAQLCISLTCVKNYCILGYRENEATCNVHGNGVHEICEEPSDGSLQAACYEEPIDLESNQVKLRGCVTIKESQHQKGRVCSEEASQLAHGFSSYGCLCFEDLCNQEFKNSYVSAEL